jgi:hypothetical protein
MNTEDKATEHHNRRRECHQKYCTEARNSKDASHSRIEDSSYSRTKDISSSREAATAEAPV